MRNHEYKYKNYEYSHSSMNINESHSQEIPTLGISAYSHATLYTILCMVVSDFPPYPAPVRKFCYSSIHVLSPNMLI